MQCRSALLSATQANGLVLNGWSSLPAFRLRWILFLTSPKSQSAWTPSLTRLNPLVMSWFSHTFSMLSISFHKVTRCYLQYHAARDRSFQCRTHWAQSCAAPKQRVAPAKVWPVAAAEVQWPPWEWRCGTTFATVPRRAGKTWSWWSGKGLPGDLLYIWFVDSCFSSCALKMWMMWMSWNPDFFGFLAFGIFVWGFQMYWKSD